MRKSLNSVIRYSISIFEQQWKCRITGVKEKEKNVKNTKKNATWKVKKLKTHTIN